MKNLIKRLMFPYAKRKWIECLNCQMFVRPDQWDKHIIEYHGLMEWLETRAYKK